MANAKKHKLKIREAGYLEIVFDHWSFSQVRFLLAADSNKTDSAAARVCSLMVSLMGSSALGGRGYKK